MISDFLDEKYVLAQARAQRHWLQDLLKKTKAKNSAALAALKKYGVSAKQIETAIKALDAALMLASAAKPGSHAAFIPSIPVLCAFQAGMTSMADRRANTVSDSPVPSPASRRVVSRSAGARPMAVIDTSATEHLKRRADAGAITGPGRAVVRAPFVEGDDIHYGLDGFEAKFGALFRGRRKFNNKAAVSALSTKPLRLFVFGDWGTGLPLAQMVTQQIRQQIDLADDTRQQHVVHLGDVYYVGEPEEYSERMIASGMWPVTGIEKDKIGSWSLNGNHDMYVGGFGYFDKLLRDGRFLRWHRDAAGEPSSFFVIEDADWQFFGLDTAWNLPSLASAIFGDPTLKDYGGQNGILTKEQVKWMASQRNAAKGCVLFTHHQPAASRTTEKQHADEAVKLLKQEGVYAQIDAWFWGHEHRCVVFKPKAERTTPRLADAPEFCACIGHGGIPVTAKNFEEDKTISDVAWQENRLDGTSPVYEGERIVPFGFARIDTAPGALDIRIFDHNGAERYQTTFVRPVPASVALADTKSPSRSISRSFVVSKQKKLTKSAKKQNAHATIVDKRQSSQPNHHQTMSKKITASTSKPTPVTVAEWTILIYMAGDNNLDSFGGKDLQEMKRVGSTDKVRVVVQRDSAKEGAHRYHVQKGTTLKQDEIAALGEINTGDPRVLEDFLNWGLAKYPAKRTMAVLWNHGNGWDDTDIYAAAKARGLKPMPAAGDGARRGIGGLDTGFAVARAVNIPRARGSFFVTAFDMKKVNGLRRAIAFDDKAQDFLDSVELKNVFSSVAKKMKKKFDVIGMDACMMSMIENGLQVQGGGEVFCGSQEIEPGNGWPYDRILAALNATPVMPGQQLASLIVKEFVASYPKTEAVTQSAFDLAALTAVQKSADAFGDLLIKALANPDDLAVEGAINRARKQSQKYEHPDYVDLWDFTAKLAALWPGCAPAAKAVQQAIGKCVFANAAPHANVSQSHGLSIYLPVDKVNDLYTRLDIAGRGWAKFLKAFKG